MSFEQPKCVEVRIHATSLGDCLRVATLEFLVLDPNSAIDIAPRQTDQRNKVASMHNGALNRPKH